MNCDAIIHRHPASWADDEPFLLWEIGTWNVIEHWAGVLFETNSTLTLWLEEPDRRIEEFVSSRFPLSERVLFRHGVPEAPGEAISFIEESGALVVRRGGNPRPYLPAQSPVKTWFALVTAWLAGLCEQGTRMPELENEVQPGVFLSHHSKVAPNAVLNAPCWIGSGSEVGGSVIGPNVIVGGNCVIADGCCLKDSYVLENTYVGSKVRLDGLVAGRGRLLEHGTGRALGITDSTLLRSLAP